MGKQHIAIKIVTFISFNDLFVSVKSEIFTKGLVGVYCLLQDGTLHEISIPKTATCNGVVEYCGEEEDRIRCHTRFQNLYYWMGYHINFGGGRCTDSIN